MVAPRLFAARPEEVMTLGALTQTANAFGKVFDSLSIVSDNWLQVNEFRSVLRRLREFEAELYPQTARVQEVEIVAQALD